MQSEKQSSSWEVIKGISHLYPTAPTKGLGPLRCTGNVAKVSVQSLPSRGSCSEIFLSPLLSNLSLPILPTPTGLLFSIISLLFPTSFSLFYFPPRFLQYERRGSGRPFSTRDSVLPEQRQEGPSVTSCLLISIDLVAQRHFLTLFLWWTDI